MKKQILNIGKALSRTEQKEVFGSGVPIKNILTDCVDSNHHCTIGGIDSCPQGQVCKTLHYQGNFGGHDGVNWDGHENLCVCPD